VNLALKQANLKEGATRKFAAHKVIPP